MNRAIGKNSQVLQILAREIQELISQEEIDMEGLQEIRLRVGSCLLYTSMEEEIARVRKADSPVREEEMTADRTTEEITEEEMTEDRRMEEELLRPFLHQLFRSRNHSARRARRTIKRKITGMTTEKKDFQKGRNKNRCHSR